jgi:O-antigen ligase
MSTVRHRAISPGAVVLAAAIPILFLHVQYQPGIVVTLGSTTVNAYLSDFAVLAVVVAAIAAGLRTGWAPLASGRALWIAGAAFLLWVFAEVAWGRHRSAAYPWHTHGVTAAKFAEYALLAPAVPLLLRRAGDLLLSAWSLVGWSVCATAIGIAQFFGAAVFLSDGTGGTREASFLGSSDFAALSGATLLLGIAASAVPGFRLGRPLGIAATVSGALGMIVAGSIASVLGLGTGLVALAAVIVIRRELDLRRLIPVVVAVAVVIVGAVAIRGKDLDAFARFVGASHTGRNRPAKVQTYAHRTLLAWLGFEIWKDHPLLGVGWEGSAEPAVFLPYLPAAHRRFPDEAPAAFPSAAPSRRYGVQNAWLQAPADLGVVGLGLWVAVFAAAAWLAARAAVARGSRPALLALAGIGLLLWLWTAQGFVAGIPLDALTWLTFGLAALRSEAGSARKLR